MLGSGTVESDQSRPAPLQQREPCPDGAVYLSTVHAAKGLEFDRVILLDDWKAQPTRERQEEERRLYYVGMARA